MSLSGIEAIHVATVLEDCVDQLAVLGKIMPVSYEERSNRQEVCQKFVILTSMCGLNVSVDDQIALQFVYFEESDRASVKFGHP